MEEKETIPCFILKLPLRVDSAGRRVFARDFLYALQLRNATLGTVLRRDRKMKQSDEWKEICRLPKGPERNQRFQKIRKDYGLSSANDFEKILKEHAERSGRKKQLNSSLGQIIADDLYRSYADWIFHKKGRPRFCERGRGLHSLRGKNNATGVVWKHKERSVRYGKRLYRAVIDPKDRYVREALADPADPSKPRRVRYCCLVRKRIRGKERFYVHLVLDGVPPARTIAAPKEECMGIDPSLRNVTCVHANGSVAKIDISAPKEDAKEVRRLQRAMDRSLRAVNPDNYNENGTPKKGARKWVRSKHYLALQAELADLKCRGVDTRRNIHGRVVRILVGSAGTIRVEENNWKALQRGRYGKSVLNGAPSEFIERLRRTAESAGSEVILVNPRELKPSQHDPMSGTFVKHELWERRCRLGDTAFFLDRDVMAALNLVHAEVTTNTYDSEALARALQTSKQHWLDAGVVVEMKTANRTSERELRRFLRRGLDPVSVERLHPHSFLRGVGPHSLANGAIVSDACPEEASSDADDGQERPPTSETL